MLPPYFEAPAVATARRRQRAVVNPQKRTERAAVVGYIVPEK